MIVSSEIRLEFAPHVRECVLILEIGSPRKISSVTCIAIG